MFDQISNWFARNRSARARDRNAGLIPWVALAFVGLLVATIVSDTAKDHERTVLVISILKEDGKAPRRVVLKTPQWFADRSILGEFIREFSFALFIAAFVGWVIERGSRRRIEAEISNYSHDIAKDVFLSTMRLSASEVVWDEIQTLITKMKVIRQELVASYELLELDNVAELELNENTINLLKSDYVAMKWNSEFWLANKSDIPVDHRLTYTYPVRQELTDWSTLSVLHEISVNDDVRTWENIKNDAISMDENEREFVWPITIPPKDRVKIRSTIYILKNHGDNEVWASILPTEEFDLTFINSTDRDLDIGIQSNFPGRMKSSQDSQSGRVRRWRATRPLLPFQSIVIWWRNVDLVSPPPTDLTQTTDNPQGEDSPRGQNAEGGTEA